MPAPRIDTTVPGWQRQAEFQRPCKLCGAQIYFIRSHQSDKLIPYTEAGISHFEDCPYTKARPNDPVSSDISSRFAEPVQAGLFGSKLNSKYPD